MTRRGYSLLETLISMALLSTALISVLGAFYVSSAGTVRAGHRMAAMNLVRKYMDMEISKGMVAGNYNLSADTSETIDGVVFTVTRSPYPATDNTEGTGLNAVHYYTIGFLVTWNETVKGRFGTVACSERAITYVSSSH